MTERKMEQQSRAPQIELETYRPSWFDRVTARVDRLPGPYWVTYVALGALLVIIGLSIRLLEGRQDPLAIQPIELLTIFQFVYVLILLAFLNKLAAKAMDAFRPAFRGDDQQASWLRMRLMTMPARSLNRLTVIFFVVMIPIGIAMMSYSSRPAAEAQVMISVIDLSPTPYGFYTVGTFTILWLVNSIFIYNTFHQLKTINYAYAQFAEILLFRQTELYAFSRISAARAIGFVLTSPLWLIVDHGIATLVVNIAFSIIAVIIFVSPLLGAHAVLSEQKDMLLRQSSERKESLIRELFARLDKDTPADVEHIGKALSSLSKAHEEIEGISTWPWQGRTIRQIAGAVTLPILIWTIQFFLSRLLES